VPIGSGAKTMMSLTESHWVEKSSGRSPSRDQFMRKLSSRAYNQFSKSIPKDTEISQYCILK